MSKEYKMTIIRGGAGQLTRVEGYEDSRNGISCNTPMEKEDDQIIGECKKIARIMRVKKLEIILKGR